MSDILSQEEIEALLNSLGSDSDGPATPAAAPAAASTPTINISAPSTNSFNFGQASRPNAKQTVAYEVYDFRRPDKFSKEQLRTLQMLHETFARLAGSGLSAYLRTPVSIDLISLEQVPYEEYLRSINSSVFTIMSLPPLTGQAVLEMEFGLVFTMIDRMLGGPGRSISRNVLTDIEKPLIRQVIERVFTALKTAWEGVVVVNPGIEGMETSAQFVQIAPPNDIVVTILFEVKIGNQRNAMSFCIPYLVLKPITTKLSAQKWFVNSSRKHSPASRRLMGSHLSHTTVDCSIRLGDTKLKLKEFLSLKPGDTLRLDQKTTNELPFLVSEVPKFKGKPALKTNKLVFSVTQQIEDSF